MSLPLASCTAVARSVLNWALTKLYGGLVSVMRPRVSTMSKRTVLTVRSFPAVS